MITALAILAAAPAALAQVKGINPSSPPYRTEPGNGQTGWNNCSTTAFSTSKCQDVWFLGVNDFCLWAPPVMGDIGATEQEEVAWCLKANHGTRLLPEGIITSATVIKTEYYIQIKGTLSDQSLINIKKGDPGGELDPHGYNSFGNPIGGLVFAEDPKENNELTQVVQWMSFIGNNEFCFRACYNSGPNPFQYCMHIYDEMGCDWVMPDATPAKTFQTCEGEPDHPAGIYTLSNGQTSTWTEGEKPTPSPYAPAKTSACTTVKSLTYATYESSKKDATPTAEPTATKTAHVSSKTSAHASSKTSAHVSSKHVSPTAKKTHKAGPTHKAKGHAHEKMTKFPRMANGGVEEEL